MGHKVNIQKGDMVFVDVIDKDTCNQIGAQVEVCVIDVKRKHTTQEIQSVKILMPRYKIGLWVQAKYIHEKTNGNKQTN